ncbi:MAG: SIR2 family protein [Clostridia bacterium]|nr:SIR2 family protein [Clostridia bacterium]
MTIRDVISRFETTPFLFVGSGLTRRYLGLPNWEGLLDHFAHEVKNSRHSLLEYKISTGLSLNSDPDVMLPKVAELIEHDYNLKWIRNPGIRHINGEALSSKDSPFRYELAQYIMSISKVNENYADEIKLLRKVSEKSISGYITTNYDMFLENLLPGYKCYIGQKDILFEPVQGIAEIYKIHGSIARPESIVITETDYDEFNRKKGYLSAKLLTIFVEYPIIFIGYSMSDKDIDNIIKWIVGSLDRDQVQVFQERFIFINYDEDAAEPRVETFFYPLKGNHEYVTMTAITLADFSLLYRELGCKERKLPVRLLRRFKSELYDFVVDKDSAAKSKVAMPDDRHISEDDLILKIARADKPSSD